MGFPPASAASHCRSVRRGCEASSFPVPPLKALVGSHAFIREIPRMVAPYVRAGREADGASNGRRSDGHACGRKHVAVTPVSNAMAMVVTPGAS
jgi:hypothetical protein